MVADGMETESLHLRDITNTISPSEGIYSIGAGQSVVQ